MTNKKDLAIFLLLVVLCAIVTALNPRFLSPANLQNTARLIGAFGYEYTTRYQRQLNYFNGSLLVRLPRHWLPGDSSVRVFAGQQRGALRCVNGVCKVFPDFTGARVELVLRF